MVEEKSRKELLEEPDPFMVFIGKAITFLKTYRQQIIMAVIGVVLVAVVFSGVVYFRQKSEDRAAAMFGKAVLKYQVASQKKEGFATYEQVKGDFKAIIDQYGSTSAGRTALIKYGDVCFEMKQYDEAVDAYLKALSAFKGQDLFVGLIHNGLAYAYEAKGDMDAAEKHFNLVLSDPHAVGKDHALYNLARIYEKQGRADQRTAALERLVSEYPDSIFYQPASETLASPASAAAKASPVPVKAPVVDEEAAIPASEPGQDQAEVPALPAEPEAAAPSVEAEGDVEPESMETENP